jgi:hypothetical protein
MIDKITTVPNARLGERIGKLSDENVVRLSAPKHTGVAYVEDGDRPGSSPIRIELLGRSPSPPVTHGLTDSGMVGTRFSTPRADSVPS